MKRLIVCCDGTWNRADKESEGKPCATNVIKVAVRTAKRDGNTLQILFYDQGVGTGNSLDRLSGGAFGEGLEDNIYDAYRFLIANYEEGDEIFLFGFSRGAFTARSIAGMIRKCGVVRRELVTHYKEALDLYRNGEVLPDDDAAKRFRGNFSVGGGDDVRIKFIGVWDTVGSLGIPLRGLRGLTRRKHQFHNVELSKTVQFAYHALAIDERRAPFEPTLWKYIPKDNQVLEQVWFAGAHSDVGGGYPETGLSDIALRWMMEKAQGAGLALDTKAVEALPLHPEPLQEIHNSKKGLYTVTPGIDREIGKIARDPAAEADDKAPDRKDPTQSIHPSVLQKWDANPKYRPTSLRNYFKWIDDPRGRA